MNTPSTYMTIQDVRAETNLGLTFIRKHVSLGTLKAFKIGRALRFRREDVQAWIESNPAA